MVSHVAGNHVVNLDTASHLLHVGACMLHAETARQPHVLLERLSLSLSLEIDSRDSTESWYASELPLPSTAHARVCVCMSSCTRTITVSHKVDRLWAMMPV